MADATDVVLAIGLGATATTLVLVFAFILQQLADAKRQLSTLRVQVGTMRFAEAETRSRRPPGGEPPAIEPPEGVRRRKNLWLVPAGTLLAALGHRIRDLLGSYPATAAAAAATATTIAVFSLYVPNTELHGSHATSPPAVNALAHASDGGSHASPEPSLSATSSFSPPAGPSPFARKGHAKGRHHRGAESASHKRRRAPAQSGKRHRLPATPPPAHPAPPQGNAHAPLPGRHTRRYDQEEITRPLPEPALLHRRHVAACARHAHSPGQTPDRAWPSVQA